MSRTPTAPVATTYRLILPEGWFRIPVNGSDADVRQAIERIVPDGMPRDDGARLRAAVEGRLQAALRRAREGDGLDVFLPLGGMGGYNIPASFVTMEIRVGASPEDSTAALDALAAEAGAETVEVDRQPAVRTEFDLSGTDEFGDDGEVSTRRVDYTMAVPGAGNLLLVAYSVYVGDDPHAPHVPMLVELFDAVMSTFRWIYRTPAAAT